MEGVVRSVNSDKKYGFIRADDGKDYFFHKEDFVGHWDELVDDAFNQKIKVEFESVANPKGPRAANVTRVSEFK